METVIVMGSDGYLSHALILRLLKKGYNVIGFDNLSRRKSVKEMGSFSAIPIDSPEKRQLLYEQYGKGKYHFVQDNIAVNYKNIIKYIKAYKPKAVVNLAQQPSGPYSHIDRQHIIYTAMNNIIGTHNVIYAIKEGSPDTHLITIGCFDKKTEILTKSGWKYFEELTLEDKVMCLNKDEKTINYERPSEIQKYKYNGEMIYIKNKRIDCLLTPNHRVVFKNNKNDNEIQIDRADKLLNRNTYIVKNYGKWHGKEKDYFIIPSCEVRGPKGLFYKVGDMKIPMNIWLKFFGFWLGDGTIIYKKGMPVGVRISVKKERKKIYMEYLKKNFPIKIFSHEKKSGFIEYEISNGQLSKYLSKIGKTNDKFIPKEFKELSSYQLNFLFEGLMESDGSVNEWNMYRYDSNSKILIDDIQEIAIKIGKSNSSNIDENCWYNYMSKKNDVFVNKKDITKILYNDYVYCCTVSTGIIMVRRNGRTYWSGNSMGEYDHSAGLPIYEGLFDLTLEGKTANVIYPRRPGSVYHSSKIASSYDIDCACRWYGISATDIMQAVVFGNWTPEIEKTGSHTRLDSDEAFGTVVNRFIVQAVLGEPLTVYGEGEHSRGFLSINDSIQCLMLAIENPPKKGEYRTWNQFAETFTMNQIAKTVQKACPFPVTINHIPTPRKEKTDYFEYDVRTDKLKNLGFKQTRWMDEEVKYVVNLLKDRDDIFPLKDVITPKIKWR